MRSSPYPLPQAVGRQVSTYIKAIFSAQSGTITLTDSMTIEQTLRVKLTQTGFAFG